jgi:hypothetical protein
MVPWWDYTSEQDLEPSCLFGEVLLPLDSEWESSTPLSETSLLGEIVGSAPRNLSGHPFVWNIASLSLWASLSKAIS